MADEVIGERLGRAEHPQQPVAQRFRRDDRAEQRLLGVRPALPLHQPGQAAQREIRVRGGTERFEQHRIVAYGGEAGGIEQLPGRRGVGETVPQQPGEGAAPPSLRSG